MRILVTGASGFIGSHIVSRALELQHETWAAIRPTSNRRYLHDPRILFIELNYCDKSILRTQLQEFQKKHGRWDVIIHCAGITQCLHHQDFYEINYKGTRILVETIMELHMIPSQFIFMSTLGSYGALHEKPPYQPITENDTPHPNTHYGRSKRLAEEYLMSISNFPYIIFRPTGVYGPRDKDFLIIIEGIRKHLDVNLKVEHQEITFVYIHDLVKAVFLAIKQNIVRRAYFVTDCNVYSPSEFGDIARKLLGNPTTIRLAIPIWIGHIAAYLCDGIGYLIGHSLTFNSDKFRILIQRNWTCETTPLTKELGYRPEYNLYRGLSETIAEVLNLQR